MVVGVSGFEKQGEKDEIPKIKNLKISRSETHLQSDS